MKPVWLHPSFALGLFHEFYVFSKNLFWITNPFNFAFVHPHNCIA